MFSKPSQQTHSLTLYLCVQEGVVSFWNHSHQLQGAPPAQPESHKAELYNPYQSCIVLSGPCIQHAAWLCTDKLHPCDGTLCNVTSQQIQLSAPCEPVRRMANTTYPCPSQCPRIIPSWRRSASWSRRPPWSSMVARAATGCTQRQTAPAVALRQPAPGCQSTPALSTSSLTCVRCSATTRP